MVINETFDLTNCDREPIHIPALIQPHGALLVLEASTFNIIQVSSNTLEILYLPPEQLLGKSLGDLLDSREEATNSGAFDSTHGRFD
ncbi:hypothetical protein MEO93_01470 [Dolichospermum sp. ST_sed3]|nr:hypothetical protein [Dolichospermum sp. ST_sed6]MDD1439061.1 hypothetical protein [Dolichospermum sp. ST_sed3]MDD1447311.1 hypothetical protein [Dolichospermum sp. ST_sed8]MDD1454767.1 hypothetical protein [Dolichospermum sp. ST_sed7]MDD1459898.1 hypothetical protein [Dolichospermum sp. ST_sed2]MDD1471635.1 hypothetical protein [Dolichospermum sp. ST_sed4]